MLLRFKKICKEERGTVIIIIAVMFSVLLSFTALAIDGGLLYLEHTRLVAAVDAATLAGAQELPDTVAAERVAKEYAQENGVDPELVSISFDSGSKEIEVSTSKTINLHFAKVFGVDNSSVGAKAKAIIAPVKSIKGAVPFSVKKQEISFGQQYILKNNDSNINGWYGALDFDGGGGGASQYESRIKYGYSGTIEVAPETIDVETGNMAGPTNDGVNYRIGLCNHSPQCTWDQHVTDCPRLVYVPIVEEAGTHKVRIVGFAAFFLEGMAGEKNNSAVLGRFIRTTMSAETDDSLSDYGLNGVKLVE